MSVAQRRKLDTIKTEILKNRYKIIRSKNNCKKDKERRFKEN